VHISANFNGRSQLEQHGLLQKDFAGQRAQLRGVVAGQVHGRARFLVARAEQLLDDVVNPVFVDCGRHFVCLFVIYLFVVVIVGLLKSRIGIKADWHDADEDGKKSIKYYKLQFRAVLNSTIIQVEAHKRWF